MRASVDLTVGTTKKGLNCERENVCMRGNNDVVTYNVYMYMYTIILLFLFRVACIPK